MAWLEAAAPQLDNLLEYLRQSHRDRGAPSPLNCMTTIRNLAHQECRPAELCPADWCVCIVGEVSALRGLAQQTLQHVWYPFTQHTGLRAEDVTTIDARSGEHMLVFKGAPAPGGSEHIEQHFDACASWWTQACPLSSSARSIEQGQMRGLPISHRQQMSCDTASVATSSESGSVAASSY